MSYLIDESELPDGSFEKATMLQNMLVDRATGGILNEKMYQQLRSEFMADPATKALLPGYVRTCRSDGTLWNHFKKVSGQYQPRREYIWESFGPLLDDLESSAGTPADSGISETISAIDSESVHTYWTKALERRKTDPAGAITAARTLLESVCKHILSEENIEISPSADLPKLYHHTASVLNLAPSQHTEEAFKKILGNCQQVVNNLATLRNQLGDSHATVSKPAQRHAALAVNLSGSMATFLIETWNAGNSETK